MNRYTRSGALYERARQVLAGGISSEFRKAGYPHPLFYTHGRGSRIYDVDGNEYLDFTLSQGPLILGHSHPQVLETVAHASAAGQLFAGQYLQELELAETIQRLVPCAELLRFCLSGSEAIQAALRVVRAVTGRRKFLKFEGHYHGWLDNVAFSINAASVDALGERDQPALVPWSEGIPPAEETLVLPWNDLAVVEKTFAQQHDSIAAIVTEPVMCNNGCILPEPGYLEGLRNLCDRYQVALIFDEIITGFRLGMAGAQAYSGVTPDLAVFGKALASGYPISVLAGKKAWMEPIAAGRVVHAGTMNSGNPCVAAALATLTVLEREEVHTRLFTLGERLMEGLRAIARDTHLPLLIQGPGPMFHMGFTTLPRVREYRDVLSYDRAQYARFVAGMHDRGIRLIGRGLWYISAAHTEEEIDACLRVARAVLEEMAACEEAGAAGSVA